MIQVGGKSLRIMWNTYTHSVGEKWCRLFDKEGGTHINHYRLKIHVPTRPSWWNSGKKNEAPVTVMAKTSTIGNVQSVRKCKHAFFAHWSSAATFYVIWK